MSFMFIIFDHFFAPLWIINNIIIYGEILSLEIRERNCSNKFIFWTKRYLTSWGWAVPSSVKLKLPAAHFFSCLVAYWIAYLFICLFACLFHSLPHCLVSCFFVCLLASLPFSWQTCLLLGLLTCLLTYFLSLPCFLAFCQSQLQLQL